MVDPLLEHLTAAAPIEVRQRFTPIPWPADLQPKYVQMNRDPNGPLPKVDTVVCMWTAAEKQAVADVYGVPESKWFFYSHLFASYVPDLTGRSPARDVHRLAEYAVVTIGTKTILLLHSQLHLATDSVALPLRRFIAQVITETGCTSWIDTGTAGGIGPDVVEGDTVIASNLVFDCTGAFRDESWAHTDFPIGVAYDLTAIAWGTAETLMVPNAGLVRPEATRAPKVWLGHDVITCDSFLFDDAEDSFGLQKYDGGSALAEEMDAAVLGLVAQDLGTAMPRYCSLRSVSDPQMPNLGSVTKEKAEASKIYDDFGYGAQVATSTATVVVAASL